MLNKKRNIKFLPNIVKSLADALVKKQILLSKDNQIVFLFGAQNTINKNSVREIFYEYTKKHLLEYQFLLAEDFFRIYNNKSIDLLTIEKNLASYTDCVLIILESPGTFAELGAFALHEELAKKILVINDKKHQHMNSFINLGPIAKINNDSKFGEVIYSDFNSILKSVTTIEDRLKENLRKRSTRVDLDSLEKFNNKSNKKYKILFLSDIISLFGPISLDEIIEILKSVYSDSDNSFIDIKLELSLLNSLDLINSIKYDNKEYYMKAVNKEFYFFKYHNLNIFKFRFQIINHYAKYHQFRLKLSKEI